MNYKNTEITVDSLITALNEGKIKLNPPFQRSSVWPLRARQRLLRNMLLERPIPAIFLFKRGEDIKTISYVLDGKQRLETLILFISDRRKNAKINQPKHYFFKKPDIQSAMAFKVQLTPGEPLVGFATLEPDVARRFLGYRIAVIEVDFPDDDDDEQANLYDVIQLFIDINETGKKVKPIEIVRALNESIKRDELFSSLLQLVGTVEPRHDAKSVFNKPVNSDYTFVLKRLRDVTRATESKRQIDIMWERLHEIALFAKTGAHRAPSEILKGMIAGTKNNKRLSNTEKKRLKRTFAFLASAYRSNPGLKESKLASDQPQFYTMVTTLLSSDLLDIVPTEKLADALETFADYANGILPPPNEELGQLAKTFIVAAGKQTTNPSKRKDRHEALVAAVKKISGI
jgi:hypothetical protein